LHKRVHQRRVLIRMVFAYGTKENKKRERYILANTMICQLLTRTTAYRGVCLANDTVVRYRGIAGDYPSVNLIRLLNMTEDEFERSCKNTVMGWKGLKILKRNAQTVFKTVYNRG